MSTKMDPCEKLKLLISKATPGTVFSTEGDLFNCNPHVPFHLSVTVNNTDCKKLSNEVRVMSGTGNYFYMMKCPGYKRTFSVVHTR